MHAGMDTHSTHTTKASKDSKAGPASNWCPCASVDTRLSELTLGALGVEGGEEGRLRREAVPGLFGGGSQGHHVSCVLLAPQPQREASNVSPCGNSSVASYTP
jgi:hypothetical protein